MLCESPRAEGSERQCVRSSPNEEPTRLRARLNSAEETVLDNFLGGHWVDLAHTCRYAAATESELASHLGSNGASEVRRRR